MPSTIDIHNALSVLQLAGFDLDGCALSWRHLKDSAGDAVDMPGGTWIYNALSALICVTVAALAAGLTLGLLGIDPLLLLIKERAATHPDEQARARKLLPIVQQHHRLLVTLLLMNAISNEALPIFLEDLVSPTVAIILSVTLVLIVGEILPSAIFTGPDQLKIASRLVPLVKVAMTLLYPIAGPIAALLDYFLHHDDDTGYNRGELAALIRIQYEERLATKHKSRAERTNVAGKNHVGGLDFSTQEELRATIRQLTHRQEDDDDDSIHYDEVTMVEGALQMKTKTAMDVFTPKRRVFSVSEDMKLTEANLVKIYAAGHSRVPVYSGKEKDRIIGILITRQLIVVPPREKRPVCTLPLYLPQCVANTIPLVDLVNMFQTGGKRAQQGGHLALVCARPAAANEALQAGKPLPKEAGYMGVITLEDVLETILQEQIYDEMDRRERRETKLARKATSKWKDFVERKKAGTLVEPKQDPGLLGVVEQAAEEGLIGEQTALLGNRSVDDDESDAAHVFRDSLRKLVGS